METYYNKEKIYNTLGILLTTFFIVKGWNLIFSPAQIAYIILIRMLFLKKQEIAESFSLLILLYIGYVFEYHYIIIYYFEYILLLFFVVFLIYNIYASLSTKKLTKSIIALFGIGMLLSINIYNSNNRLFKDPQLHKAVSNKYEFQFVGKKSNLKEMDSRLERIKDLDINTKWSIKTLKGIENLSSLRELNIYDQDKLLDYTSLTNLSNLEVMFISGTNVDFSVNNLPKLNQLQRLYINLGQNQFLADEIIDLKKFSKLKSFSFTSIDGENPITIDITQTPNLESVDILGNVGKIIGLQEAMNLKEIRIYPDEMNYLDVVKKLRPDIDTK